MSQEPVIVNSGSTQPEYVGNLKPLLRLLRRAPASNDLRAIWGGGGLTLHGHLSTTDKKSVRRVAEAAARWRQGSDAGRRRFGELVEA